jgi:hypothetical protein
MLAHLRRDGVLRRRRNRLRRVLDAAAFNAIVAMVIVLSGACSVRAGDHADRLDTEHLFGFVEGADIGEKGESELVSDTSQRAGKSGGAFADTGSELEIKYMAFENFRISASATLAYYGIAGVPGMADVHRATIQSAAADARFRLLDRADARAPFGLTLSVSPHRGFVDETSGVRTEHAGAEIRLLADRELAPDRLVGAVNLLFANDRARLLGSDGIEHESLLGAGAALAGQLWPGLWLGAEARYLRDYSGAALNVFSGEAVYAGPTAYLRLGPKAFVSAALDFQVRGRAVAVPGALDLMNFERIHGKLRFGLEF